MTDQPQENPEQQPLYRRQAYEQRGRIAPIDGILRVSAPHDWLVLIGLAVVVVAVIAWSFVGRLESGISAPCALQAAGERHAAVASTTGTVAEVLVEPGEQVNAGDPLARVAAPELSLAADLAQARSAALAAQHPDSAEAAVAAAEAEALAAAETAGTLVLSPASGVLVAPVLTAGTEVSPGAVVAEVLQAAAAPPTAIVELNPDQVARVRPSMAVSVAVTAAGTSDVVRADAHVNTADTHSTAEFDDPPTAFEALAMAPQGEYYCDARIVTDSRRPIELLIGRG